uniref:Uncharacterized protein n=1 Tax=Cajanus cajan TaxID=3821 RepID=A0A151SHL3_CAJCA|nr:hypothetical protein KK1_000530 [Cajanus cajan]
MSEEGLPKLYTNKPRKAQLKHVRGQQKSNGFSSPTATGTHGPAAAPPPPPKEPFVRRYKFLWPMLLAVNLGVGGDFSSPPMTKNRVFFFFCFFFCFFFVFFLFFFSYLFMRTNKKDTGEEEQDASPVSTKDATAPVVETSVPSPPITNPVIKRESIPENQQRELLKWILEEKRKVKAKDAEEKQKIDEEKALLKKLIRSKSIPSV